MMKIASCAPNQWLRDHHETRPVHRLFFIDAERVREGLFRLALFKDRIFLSGKNLFAN